jgi:hypothetical protein
MNIKVASRQQGSVVSAGFLQVEDDSGKAFASAIVRG